MKKLFITYCKSYTALSTKDKNKCIFIFVLLIAAVLTALIFVAESIEHKGALQKPLHITYFLIEITIFLVSIFGVVLLINNTLKQRQTLEENNLEIQQLKAELKNAREPLRLAGKMFTESVQQQFEVWSLTPSEKEVAGLLLKGLSFDEIATARCTKEKTIRQQAGAIYRKANLHGRHELSAWFFEDLLQ